MNTKKGIITIVLVAAMLVSMIGMASADDPVPVPGSIHWDLDSDTVMYQGGQGHSETGNVPIADGGSYLWIADKSATPAAGVYFPAEVWQGRLTTGQNLTGGYIVDVGWYTTAGGFTSNGVTGGETDYYSSSGASHASIVANGFTVPQGGYLAFNVTSNGTAFTVTTDGSSYLDYPLGSQYPVPELSTLILMSVGLLALVGYVGLGRRRN